MGGGSASATSLATASTTTAETVSTASAVAGTPVTFGATVTASDGTTPTGSVQFVAQFTAAGSSSPSTVSLGQATLGGGSASLTTTALLAGTYQVTAQYNPNGSIAWNGSSSSPVSVAISSSALATTTLSFTESTQAIDAGASVTLSTTLSTAPGEPSPTGIVRFAAGPDVNDMITLGQATVVDGTATLPVSGWSANTYVLVAQYAGDGVYAAAKSGSLSLTVSPVSVAVTTTTTLTLQPSTIVEGQSVTILAHVVKAGTPNPPPGGPIVSFTGGVKGSDPSTWVKVGDPGQAPLDANGDASETVAGWSPGTYTIVAQYSGDVLDAASSGSATLTVLPADTPAPGTSLSYTGDTSGAWHRTAVLSGRLTDADGAPLAGETVTFALGGDSCTATTDASGDASCRVTIDALPGDATVTATFGGDATHTGSSASDAFTVSALATATVAADVTATPGATATLSATLTDVATGAAIPGETLALAVGADTCTGVTDASGTATCTVTASEGIGGHAITASFPGDGGYAASSGSGTLTIRALATATTYTGDAQDVAGGTATLSATVAPAPDGGTVTFTLGTQSCSALAAGGAASCTIPLTQDPGDYTVDVAYGGDASYVASSTSSPFTIVSPVTTTHIAAIAPVLAGSPVQLSATVAPASASGPVTFSSGDATLCTATLASGAASCTTTFAQPGSYTVTASYGDSTDSTTVVVYSYAPGGGTFVVGDLSAAGTVTFWGSQWWKVNALSGGAAPSSLEGYAAHRSGGTWSTDPGDSAPPPAGSLPAYMAVIVTSSASKSGSRISGNVVAIAIVKTNPGYAPDPGHTGTGTVVATFGG